MLLIITYIISLLTFVLFGLDKHRSVYNKRRISEFVLMLFSFLFGAFGGLCGMILFQHKTLHKMFLYGIPIMVIIQITIIILVAIL